MRHWGPEADLWSLGMVTYQMLSGAGQAANPVMQMQPYHSMWPCHMLVMSALAFTVHLATMTANGQCRISVGTTDHVKCCRLSASTSQAGAIKYRVFCLSVATSRLRPGNACHPLATTS